MSLVCDLYFVFLEFIWILKFEICDFLNSYFLSPQ